ncbi:MAG: hypothetical protein M1404_00980 [Acidobacteria bacterium]|nr:hypothetical protein [Acidobacteriota bacterium]
MAVVPCPGGSCRCSPDAFKSALANPRTITNQVVSVSGYIPGHDAQYRGYYSKILTGNRLKLDWADMEIVFHPKAGEWTGTWSGREVVLRRPTPSRGVKRSPFVGEWAGLPTANKPTLPAELHIAESLDGTLTAWLDRKIGALDCETRSVRISQSSGELVKIFFDSRGKISMQTTNPLGASFRYLGTLTADSTEIVGAWSSQDGEHSSAPGNFRRIPGKARWYPRH